LPAVRALWRCAAVAERLCRGRGGPARPRPARLSPDIGAAHGAAISLSLRVGRILGMARAALIANRLLRRILAGKLGAVAEPMREGVRGMRNLAVLAVLLL